MTSLFIWKYEGLRIAKTILKIKNLYSLISRLALYYHNQNIIDVRLGKQVNNREKKEAINRLTFKWGIGFIGNHKFLDIPPTKIS